MRRTDVATPWEILANLWQLSQLIMDDAAPGLEELGLHPKAFFLLATVERCPFPAELARIMSLPPPTVTYIVAGRRPSSRGIVPRRSATTPGSPSLERPGLSRGEG